MIGQGRGVTDPLDQLAEVYAVLGPQIVWSNGLGGVSVRCESCGQGFTPTDHTKAVRHTRDCLAGKIEGTLHAAGRSVPYRHPDAVEGD